MSESQNDAAGRLIAESLLKDPEVKRVIKQQLYNELHRAVAKFANEELKQYHEEIRTELTSHREKFLSPALIALDNWWAKNGAKDIENAKKQLQIKLNEFTLEQLHEIVSAEVRSWLRMNWHKVQVKFHLDNF